MIVLGSSPLERFWRDELERELKQLPDRADITWCDGLSLEQICQRAATLPAHSAILYALMLVDAAGVPHEQDRSLETLHQSAAAPLFGAFENQLGRGIVGGPLLSVQETGRQAAQVALELLGGRSPGGMKRKPVEFSPPAFDWRELRRWGISEKRLPAGSTIRFKPASWWMENGSMILAIASVLTLQTGLIAALLAQRARRRRAEGNSRSLAGQLLTAHEDERRRMARELHDDLTQRLARLSIDVARMEASSGRRFDKRQAVSIREELVRLSEDVHALSYRLHPSMLDDLGLLEAIKAECDSFYRRESIPVQVRAARIGDGIPRDIALCLYRITQEALRNVARHAQASMVDVSLARVKGGLQLAVSDDGKGFDPANGHVRASLGHASMRERVHLLHGNLKIHSAPGHGSTISAWVPLNGERS
jgi:signal transduction histidine kinase